MPGGELKLDADELLFAIGDDGGDVFVVIEGELDVVVPTSSGEVVVGGLGPDDVVGEITAVVGGNRTATVRARTPVVVRRLIGDEFEDWLGAHPDRAERISAEARMRIDRTRVAQVVAELVGAEHRDLIDEMTDAVEWLTIEAGQVLFEQGDVADAAYILVSGQMRVLATDTDGTVVVDTRIGRGDLIGETGLIEQAPRNASGLAIRDCTLAKLPKAEFERLTAEYPALMIPLVRKVIERVSDRTPTAPHAGLIGVIVTATGPDCAAVGSTMADEMGRFGTALHLDPDGVAQFLNRRDIAQARAGTAADTRLVEFLHEVDVAHRWVVLEADAVDDDWTRRVVRSADRMVLICSARPDPAEREAIATVRRLVEATLDYDLWVVQVNPAGSRTGAGARALSELTGCDRLIHVRRGDDRSTRRAGRLVSGNGTGVAFSGGGARSFGQIGALKAMHELGIEVDAVAGTSMGSVIGAFVAMIDDIEGALKTGDELLDGLDVLDYTLPLSSLLRAKKVTEVMEHAFGATAIEEAMLPFVCLSTNLTEACLVEHRRGSLVQAMRASVSLPGVFPPVVVDGDLLVDGGVLENLPARPLREDPAISTVIGIDVAPPGGPRAAGDFGLALSGTDILRRRLLRERFRHPPLAHTVISSMLVGSSMARAAALDDGLIDLYLSLNLAGIKLLDFGSYHEAVERGYRDAKPALETWLATRP